MAGSLGQAHGIDQAGIVWYHSKETGRLLLAYSNRNAPKKKMILIASDNDTTDLPVLFRKLYDESGRADLGSLPLSSSSMKANAVNDRIPKWTTTADTSKKRIFFNEAVKASCRWKLSPELSGFYVGMSLDEAKRVPGRSLSCKYSTAFNANGKTLAEQVRERLHDDFKVDGDSRAAARCDTNIESNEVALWFFPESAYGPLVLGKVYNWLNMQKDGRVGFDSITTALSDKFGVDLNERQNCNATDGNAFRFYMTVSRPRVWADGSPSSGFISFGDNRLIESGSALVAERHEAEANLQKGTEKKDAADKVKKGVY